MANPVEIVSTDSPYLPIRAEILNWSGEGSALLDTGFTGELIVPESVLSEDIGPPADQANLVVGDGRIVNAPIYLGTLELVGFPPITDVAIIVLGHQYIVGREILDLFDVTFEHGERAIIRP